MRSDATIAPTNWAIQYQIVSSALSRRSRNMPSETIGLKCPPDTSPKAYRPARSATPKPKAIVTLAAESPPLPRIASEPTNTSMSVPKNSATYFCQAFTCLTSMEGYVAHVTIPGKADGQTTLGPPGGQLPSRISAGGGRAPAARSSPD